MLPLVAVSSPRIVRPSVVLPEPDSPTRPSTSPRRSSSEPSPTARTASCPSVPAPRARPPFSPFAPARRGHRAAAPAEVRREPLYAHQHLAGGPGRGGGLVGADG